MLQFTRYVIHCKLRKFSFLEIEVPTPPVDYIEHVQLCIEQSLAHVVLGLKVRSVWKNPKWKQQSDPINLLTRILDWWSLYKFLESMGIVFTTIIKKSISKKIRRQDSVD